MTLLISELSGSCSGLATPLVPLTSLCSLSRGQALERACTGIKSRDSLVLCSGSLGYSTP